MGLFDGIENAKSSDQLPKITPGRYRLKNQATKSFTSRKGIPFFIHEFLVLESQGEGALAAGTQGCHMIALNKDAALGNVKGYMAAALDETEAQITAVEVEEAVSPDQPIKDTVTEAYAYLIKTKAGNDFTVVKYSPYNDPTQSATPAPPPAVTTSTAKQAKRS